MGEKRMLIVPVELIKKIDDNRGDMGQAEFVEFLIDSQFKKEPKKENNYITKEEFQNPPKSSKEMGGTRFYKSPRRKLRYGTRSIRSNDKAWICGKD